MSDKIAIYGDSYASLNLNHPNDGRGQSWIDVVRQHYNVTNFACPATSIFWSYQKFYKENQKFDYNIFIITHPDRIFNQKLTELIQRPHWYTHYEHVKLCARNYSKTYPQMKVVESVKNYFDFWKDEETENIMHLALIENLMLKHNNCLFINAFSKNQCPRLINECGLCDITTMEQISTGWIEKYASKGLQLDHITKDNYLLYDYRLCHLSEDNNVILGNMILDSLKTKQLVLEFKLEDFVVPKMDIDHYVRWRKFIG